ncbi:FAD-binding domain-containing protein [Aphanothece stagnina]|uniref:FAD-binding domain-containing protein n=2 Tax=Aphanothece TaxID=1121 RepID=UPI00398F18DB
MGGGETVGSLQVMWFKRDLRVTDHRPLLEASRHGPVLPLVVIEPELWRQPDASARQWAFCAESLIDLGQELACLGQPLVVRVGEVEEVLERARRRFGIGGLWSHEETGNGWTYARDRRVAAWARRHGITWRQCRQFGVIRRLPSRDGWARRWQELMGEPLSPPPPRLPCLEGVDPGTLPDAAALGLADDPCPGRQPGGRREGLALLESFLQHRGARYHLDLSSPLTATSGCSRLSAHLAWGTLSLRQVVHACRHRRQELGAGASGSTVGRTWQRALRGFQERLHWHCHFIQKLECQPDLEFRELHPLMAGLASSDPVRLEAWARGRTGLPFVDACMRSLRATGWLNFRMRAMLLSVACHHLNLPWRDAGLVLARLFVDYEPGIHWSQCQMQAGTTGINTVRIYNPIKQGEDHDPHGSFIGRWLPELAQLPPAQRHRPWTLEDAGPLLAGRGVGLDYPQPVVDPAAAAREARERIHTRRRQEGFSERADTIQQRHGSRRSGLRPGERRRRGSGDAATTDRQLKLDLG